MKMKNTVALFLSMSMLCGLTACGTKNDANGSAGGDAGETVLTIPSYMVGENAGAVYFEPAVERFNEKYDGKYEIVLEEITEQDYFSQLSLLAKTGDMPMIVCGAPATTSEFVDTVLVPQELYYPMNDFLDEHPEIKDLCIDSSVEYSTLENGDIVGVPVVYTPTVGLFYNEDLFKPSKSISEMTMDEFMKEMEGNDFAFQTVDNAWTSMLFLTALVANEEGGMELLAQYDGDILYDYNQEPILNAVKKLQQLWGDYSTSNSLGAAYADAANAFMSNKAAVICNGPWMNGEFSESASANWSDGFDGSKVRADIYPGNVAFANTATYGRWIVTNNYESQEELDCALAFIEFLYSQDELETFMLTEGGQCPKMELDDEFKNKLSENSLLADQAMVIDNETNIVPNISTIMPASVANQVFAADLVQLVNGAITPEEFCNDLTVKAMETKN